MTTNLTVLDQLMAARAVGTPLVGIRTRDAADTIQRIRGKFEDGAKTPIPVCQWDSMDGLRGLNAKGKAAVKEAMPGVEEKDLAAMTANPQAALGAMAELPGTKREGGKPDGDLLERPAMIFMLNAHLFFEDKGDRDHAQVIQGIWNLRDKYKKNGRTLILLGPDFKFPPELESDVIVFEEPLPTDAELERIIMEQAEAVGVDVSAELLRQAVDALRGMPAFTAEQIAAMSVREDGLDMEMLWERKVRTIEQIEGLSVDRGDDTFDDVGGIEVFKEFASRIIDSPKAPLLYVRIDEINTMLAGNGTNGAAGDNTGVTQDQVGTFLREMEDNGWNGFVALGHPGCAKSQITKALANTATKRTKKKVLSLALDLGGAKDGIVGSSEKRIRAIMRALKSLAGKGRVCFIGTCNDLDVMPPALRRRFKLGLWMFELPDNGAKYGPEKKQIWKINLAKYNIKETKLPDDTNWTGADIRNVCEMAEMLQIPLADACQYVTFVALNDPASIDKLRRKADGKYLSANSKGVYRATYLTKGVAAEAAVEREELEPVTNTRARAGRNEEV